MVTINFEKYVNICSCEDADKAKFLTRILQQQGLKVYCIDGSVYVLEKQYNDQVETKVTRNDKVNERFIGISKTIKDSNEFKFTRSALCKMNGASVGSKLCDTIIDKAVEEGILKKVDCKCELYDSSCGRTINSVKYCFFKPEIYEQKIKGLKNNLEEKKSKRNKPNPAKSFEFKIMEYIRETNPSDFMLAATFGERCRSILADLIGEGKILVDNRGKYCLSDV